MATNKNEKMDAIIVTLGGIYPFFRRKSKSIKTCLFFKPLEFEGLKKKDYINFLKIVNTYFKAIQSRLISNYGEFAIIKIRIVYLLPNSNIFQCITIT